MISGIGVDIVRIERMEGKERGFFSRFLSQKELEEDITAEYAASRFAAKEAFSKALGTGVSGFSMKDITVLSDDSGKPFLELSGKAAAKAEGLKLFLSITHEKEYAVAMVVAEYAQ